MNYTTYRSINRTVPSKNIACAVTGASDNDYWYYDDGMGDPWWEMGGTSRAYRYQVTITVSPTRHSSYLTRKPFEYNGLDISPNLWIGSLSTGNTYKIISIKSKTETTAILIVEDEDRRNIMNSPSNGIATPAVGPAIIFELGDDGLPVLSPLPSGVTSNVPTLMALMQIEGRFRVFNENKRFRLFKLAHDFLESDLVKVNPETRQYEKATSIDSYVVGTVVDIGPGPNHFYITPTTKLIQDLEPGLPGQKGDLIWVDNETGLMTTEQGANVFPSYVQLTNPVECHVTGTVPDPVTKTDSDVIINHVSMRISTGKTLDDIIDIINTKTTEHGVVASKGSPTFTVTANRNIVVDLTDYDDYRFSLNGVEMSATKPGMLTASNLNRLGNKNFVKVINELTHEHGVVASISSNRLVLQDMIGEGIVIENVFPSEELGGLMPFTQASGLESSYEAATPDRLKLVRYDGGEITITSNGSFMTDTGIMSANNGQLPVAVVVDKSMMSNQAYTVQNMEEINALEGVKSGDHVFVKDWDGSGEWAYFIRTGNNWTMLSNEDSAKTDASTLTIDVSTTSENKLVVGNISPESRILNVVVEVVEPFNSPLTSLTIGTDDDFAAIMKNTSVDLESAGSYETGTRYINKSGEEQDIFVYFDNSGSTSGIARVIITYV